MFGHIDRPFEAVQGGQVASGLYQAVSLRLPGVSEPSVIKAAVPDIIQNVDTHKTVEPYLDTVPELPQNSNQVLAGPSDKIETSSTPVNNPSSTTDYQPSPDLSSAEAPSVDTASDTLISSKPAPVSKTPPTPEMFTQLLIELNEIEVVQSADNMAYQQACRVLDQFEEHIAKQNKPVRKFLFTKSSKSKKQALLKLQEAANAGSTAAMLRLAMYELLGEGLAVDNSAGTATRGRVGQTSRQQKRQSGSAPP